MMIDEGKKYDNRHKAVIDIANNSLFNVGELQEWAKKNKHPFDFSIFYKDSNEIPLEHHYNSFDGLAWTMAQHHMLLNLSNGILEFSESYEVDVDRLLLCAVFDGELSLYKHGSAIKIDVEGARIKYNQQEIEAEPITLAIVTTGETKLKWTPEKLTELNQFYLNEKNVKKTYAFAKATADHYGITTKRVEQLLNKYAKHAQEQKPIGLASLVSQTVGTSHHKK